MKRVTDEEEKAMEFEAWKTALINEIETAAEERAELALLDPDDPQFGKSQRALFNVAEQLRALPPDHATLKALFNEEAELSNLMRARLGEPERRYRDVKEDSPAAHGIEHKPSNNVVDITFRRALEARLRRHRLFGLMVDLGCIAPADAEAHECVAIRQDKAPDLRLELIDLLMLALHRNTSDTATVGSRRHQMIVRK
jgi:hypothetical protein